jgi:hypothetical protein
MEQTYSEQDDLAHIRWLANAFVDPRYIRIENKPLFISSLTSGMIRRTWKL